MTSSGNNTIADIYRAVIADVINQVKESFLDENVDVDILSQLKKEWEDKVSSSGSVELEQPVRPANVPPPPMRNVQQMRTVQPAPIRQQQPQMMANPAQMHEQRIQMQYTQQPNQGLPQGIQQQLGQVRMIPQMPGQPQQFIMANGQNFPPGQVVIMQQPNGQHIPMTIGQNGMIQQHRVIQQPQLSHMNQMDGNGGIGDDLEEQGSSTSRGRRTRRGSKSCRKIKGSGASNAEALAVLGSIMKSMQLDGGGGGMSDSSSEDEEEDDPLRRIADRIGDGEVEDGDQIAEEDPLNSGDDQSDDEDLTMLFDAENVVMCQFEKVNRARTKWKFQLKDGIMHIEKKDYCFQKCSGEAEW